jgi:hypothetical protein
VPEPVADGRLSNAVLSASKASVRPLGLDPLTVEGAGFGAGEKVTVLVTSANGSATRRAVASAHGAFRVVFAGHVTPTGAGLRIRALGSSGHAAIWAPRAAHISPPTN